jgi:hypothetical protein
MDNGGFPSDRPGNASLCAEPHRRPGLGGARRLRGPHGAQAPTVRQPAVGAAACGDDRVVS